MSPFKAALSPGGKQHLWQCDDTQHYFGKVRQEGLCCSSVQVGCRSCLQTLVQPARAWFCRRDQRRTCSGTTTNIWKSNVGVFLREAVILLPNCWYLFNVLNHSGMSILKGNSRSIFVTFQRNCLRRVQLEKENPMGSISIKSFIFFR